MVDEPIPDAKAWMVKAWRDLETARRAATGEPPFYDVAEPAIVVTLYRTKKINKYWKP
jgi:hypothetical protein